MSRVLLISTNTCRTPYPVYPLGMATVAGALTDAGHEVRQFDWLVADRRGTSLEQAVVGFGPDVVALSIRNIDQIDSLAELADTWELESARDVVALVRRLTDVPVVIGGPAVSMMPHQARDYVGANVAVVGEGEHCILEVVEAIAQGRTMPPLWPAVSGRLCGNRQSAPRFEASFVSFYWNASGIIGLQSKRGCPYHCCYCVYPELEGRRFRPRPVDVVVGDLERLKCDFQVDTVFFADSVFNDPDGHYLELAETLAARELGVNWAAYFSPRGLTREAVTLCRRAGLYAVELGTDATSDTTLQGMGKPFLWTDVRDASEAFVQAGVACAHFVIFGGPDETAATVGEGLDNIAGLDHCVVFGFSGIRVYPGTPLHRRAVTDGVVHEADSLFKPVYYVSPGVDKAWLDRQLTEAWASRQDRVFPPQEGQRVAASLRAFGWKGLLWDRMIGFPQNRAGHTTKR